MGIPRRRKKGNPKCKKCFGTMWARDDSDYMTICQDCCSHEKGFRNEEGTLRCIECGKAKEFLAEPIVKKEKILTDETKVVPLSKPKLQLVSGGEGGDENWLNELEVGTAFLSREKNADLNNPFLNCYQVLYKTPTTTLLQVEMPDNTVARPHVDTLRFSRRMELIVVLGVQLEEEDKESETTDGRSDPVSA